jgi:hypothetical protein
VQVFGKYKCQKTSPQPTSQSKWTAKRTSRDTLLQGQYNVYIYIYMTQQLHPESGPSACIYEVQRNTSASDLEHLRNTYWQYWRGRVVCVHVELAGFAVIR